MSVAEYLRQTSGLTISVATAMATSNPGSTFVYLSGEGADSSEADSSERDRRMWALAREETENAVLAMPNLTVYIVRPGFVLPRTRATSRVTLYRWLYPILKRLAPRYVTSTTEQLGRALIALARTGSTERILLSRHINALADRN